MFKLSRLDSIALHAYFKAVSINNSTENYRDFRDRLITGGAHPPVIRNLEVEAAFWSCSRFHASLFVVCDIICRTYSIWLITGICNVIRRWLSLPVENNFPFLCTPLLNLRFLRYFLFRKLLRKAEAKWLQRSENKNLCFSIRREKVPNDFYSIANNFLFLRFPFAMSRPSML